MSLVAANLGREHGVHVILDDVSVTVAPGDVLGVDSGGASAGYLPQEPDRAPGESLAAFLARRTGVAAASAGLGRATAALTEGDAGADDLYAEALDAWLALHEWAYAAYPTSKARTRALPGFLTRYNHHRPHEALNGSPPAKRLAERANRLPPTPRRARAGRGLVGADGYEVIGAGVIE